MLPATVVFHGYFLRKVKLKPRTAERRALRRKATD